MCYSIQRDFITWAADNIKLSEVNIACSAISKMFQERCTYVSP
jgi:hypothetical protein